MGKPSLGQTLFRAFAPLLIYGIFTELFLGMEFRLWSVSVQAGLLPEWAGPSLPESLFQMANALAGGSLILLFIWKTGKEKREKREIFSGKRMPLLLAAGACCCVGASGAVSLLCLPEANGALPAGEALSQNSAATVAASFICTGAVIPAAEELIFRQAMYGEFRKRFGVPASAAASSLLFGLYHGRVAQGIYAGILGIFLALLFERRGFAGDCAAVHISANVTALSLSLTPWPSLLAGHRPLLAAQTALFLALFFAAAFCLLCRNEKTETA